MFASPTLVHTPAVTRAELENLVKTNGSACCDALVDSEGICFNCELAAPIPAPLTCSDCGNHVYDVMPDDAPLLECGTCGARWAEIPKGFHPVDLHGMEANAWEPTMVPAPFAQYIGVLNGRIA